MINLFNYREDTSIGDKYREQYLSGIDKLIENKRKFSSALRNEYIKDIFDNPEAYRSEYKKMLGFPLTEKREENLEMKKEFLTSDNGIDIYRVFITVLGCVPFYGMLFVHSDGKKRPLVIASHGGLGTPEFAAGLYEGGSANYNSMIERIVSKDVNVFAPQLLLWDVKRFKCSDKDGPITEQDKMRRARDNDLKQLGMSITSVEIYCMQCALDCLEKESFVDKKKIGMAGLSYGGFYTLYTAACDTRIKSAVACSHFNDRCKYDWSDYVWDNSAHKFLDAEVLCLVYPRKMYIEVGAGDELFDFKSAEKEFGRFENIVGKKNDFAKLKVFDGTHEFYVDDDFVDRMTNDLKNI